MKNKMRLFVVEPNNSGGLVHYTYQLCTALANEGVDVTLITAIDYELAYLPHNFQVVKMLHLWKHFDPQSMQSRPLNSWQRGWKKIRWMLRRGWRGLRLLLAWMRLSLYIIRNRPDIVQFTRIEFPFEAFFISQLQRQGLTISQICHEFEARESNSRLASFFFGKNQDVYTCFSAIFFHAQENRGRFLSLYPSVSEEKTYVIPHGNSSWLTKLKTAPNIMEILREKYGLQEGERVVLFFGLLSPSKGLDDLIDAFALARKSCTAKLLIAGYPTKYIDMDAFRARIEALHLTDQVILDARYLPLEEIGSLMSMATVVVYPYRSSTQSGALQAAYTFGRPVIATAVGGLPEAVEDGKNGFLVPAQSPQALAEKIAILVNDSELAAKMGHYALYLSETRFGWQSIAQKIIQVYEGLLNSGT
jgi:glycosyltransferase involved in cell wall biosynthesis